MKHNILYSFRRCPYAIRARWALLNTNQVVELREVDLKNKPIELIQISKKATVPVLKTNLKASVTNIQYPCNPSNLSREPIQ